MLNKDIQKYENRFNDKKTLITELKKKTVWYDLIDFETIITPEWTFNFDELKRFKN
ncbi:MAG: hypothetical protein ACJ0O0_04490 [Flavobacteriaceae bacterium]